jgi:hypothetical protein
MADAKATKKYHDRYSDPLGSWSAHRYTLVPGTTQRTRCIGWHANAFSCSQVISFEQLLSQAGTMKWAYQVTFGEKCIQ